MAREAFLRGTVSTSTTYSVSSSSTSNSANLNHSQTSNASSVSLNSPSALHNHSMLSARTTNSNNPNENSNLTTNKTSGTSILRETFQNSQRETMLTETSKTLNSSVSSSSTSSHFYQNVQQLKPIQNLHNNTPPTINTVNNNTNINGHSNVSQNNTIVLNGVKNHLSKQRTLDGYVGFANLPNQVYRKSVKKGFEFNLMVIGESGLGKSTFINSLFLAELYNATEFPGTFERRKKTTFVDATTVLLSEKGVDLRLTVVDTPGFGDSIDNTNCWQPIVEYIDAKYEEFLNAESKVNRKLPINDQRIHCCLYFISPGHT